MEKENQISQEVLAEIKNKNIRPKSRWSFILHDYTIWGLGILAGLLGTVAFSVILYMSTNNDWDLYKDLSGSFIKFLLATTPYFWLLVFGGFLFLLFYNIRHSKKGYRYSLGLLATLIIAASVILGGLFYNLGLAKAIDNTFSEIIPVYRTLNQHRFSPWQQMERGFMMGQVERVMDQDNFIIKDLDREEWIIMHSQTTNPCWQDLRPGDQVRLRGEIESPHEFRAEMIRPAASCKKKMMIAY